MRQGEIIRTMLAERPLLRVSELLAAGVSRSTLNDATERALVGRPGRGLVSTLDAEHHPRMADAVACLSTGGIIGGLSAALRHELVDEAPDGYDMLVPAATAGKAQTTFPCRLRRYANPLAGTLGVESETVLGVEIRMTGRARTVVDLYRFGARDQNVLEAVHRYLREGGNGNALQGLCMRLSPPTWSVMQRDVSNFELARARAGDEGRETDDAPDCEPGDDHGGGPALVR